MMTYEFGAPQLGLGVTGASEPSAGLHVLHPERNGKSVEV